MSVLTAFYSALRSTLAAPRLLLVLWLTLLLAAAPFGLLMQHEIARDIGASRVQEQLRQRMDMVWLSEFRDRGGSMRGAFEPVTTSRLDFLHNLDLLFSGRLFSQHKALVAAGVGYAVVWLLTLGGVIDRFARGGGRFVLSQFLAACGRYFPRLAVVTAVSAVGYWVLYRLARFGYGAIEAANSDLTVESTLLTYYLLAAIPLLVLAALVMVIADYARIAAVTEERGGWSALARGFRFVSRRPWSVFALALIVALSGGLLVALRTLLAPGVGEATTLGILGVFLVGQLFVAARLVLRVTGVGAELALYRALRR